MSEFRPFGKIYQLKNTLKLMEKYGISGDYVFEGRVKLHGTNAGIGYADGKRFAQSRTRLLSPQSDNFGFAAWVESLGSNEVTLLPFEGVVYGEWVGPGIQKGAALAELPERMFVPFNTLPVIARVTINVDDAVGLSIAQGIIHEETLRVEEECPFAAKFGIRGIGEGLVWSCPDLPRDYWFKSKGTKHTKSHVKSTKAPSLGPEQLESVKEFLDWAMTDERLHGGLDWLRSQGEPIFRRNTGTFIRYIQGDVEKECQLELEAIGVDIKFIRKSVGACAAKFYKEQL